MTTHSSNFRPCPSRLLRAVMLSVSFCAPAVFVGCVGTTTVDSTATVERLVEQRQYDGDAVVEVGSESIDLTGGTTAGKVRVLDHARKRGMSVSCLDSEGVDRLKFQPL